MASTDAPETEKIVKAASAPIAAPAAAQADALLAQLPASRFAGYPRAATHPDFIETEPATLVARAILAAPCARCGDNYLNHPTASCRDYWQTKPEPTEG